MVLQWVTMVAAGASGSQQTARAGPADRQQDAEPAADSGGGAAAGSSPSPAAEDFGAALQRARHALGVADERWEGILTVSPDMTVTEAFQHANHVAHK
jgi:hypothetical protein